jgi:hypothetical protein
MQAQFRYKKKINVITAIFYHEGSTKLNSELLIKNKLLCLKSLLWPVMKNVDFPSYVNLPWIRTWKVALLYIFPIPIQRTASRKKKRSSYLKTNFYDKKR